MDPLKGERLPCFTSNFVLDETLTLLARRTDYRFASERGRALYSSGELHILRPTLEDELAAFDWFEKYADQEVSFTAMKNEEPCRDNLRRCGRNPIRLSIVSTPFPDPVSFQHLFPFP